ncbi:MAG: hypothetical protein HC923_11265, partial [Myxococcales bacterium]|nr:hypothetical protein [Myxococcales bacterium]
MIGRAAPWAVVGFTMACGPETLQLENDTDQVVLLVAQAPSEGAPSRCGSDFRTRFCREEWTIAARIRLEPGDTREVGLDE